MSDRRLTARLSPAILAGSILLAVAILAFSGAVSSGSASARSISERTGIGRYELSVDLSPGAPGPNKITITVSEGNRLVRVSSAHIVGAMVSMAMTPLASSLKQRRPGDLTGHVVLSMSGLWSFELYVEPKAGGPVLSGPVEVNLAR